MKVDKTKIGKEVHENNDNIDINKAGSASDVILNKIKANELLDKFQEGSRTDTTKEEIIEKDKIVDVINLSDEARKETDQESWRQRYQRRISLDPWMISQQSKETSEM